MVQVCAYAAYLGGECTVLGTSKETCIKSHKFKENTRILEETLILLIITGISRSCVQTFGCTLAI